MTPPFREFAARRFAMQGAFWSWTVFERAGGALAFVFAHLGLSPSAVTVLGGVIGVAGAVVLGEASDVGSVVLAAVLLLLAYTLDCSDGQLARATGRTSAIGAWLDVTVDAVVMAFLTASVAAALLADGGQHWPELLLAGAFGASRAAGLMTGTLVRSSRDSGRRSGGAMRLVKSIYGSTVETPFVYAVLCATRLSPTAFRIVLLAIAVLTVGRTAMSARRHFRTLVDAERAADRVGLRPDPVG